MKIDLFVAQTGGGIVNKTSFELSEAIYSIKWVSQFPAGDLLTESVTVTLSRHFCASLHVGHARSIRPVFDYRITGVEAQIKTNKQNN